jgi:hypothetical protein
MKNPAGSVQKRRRPRRCGDSPCVARPEGQPCAAGRQVGALQGGGIPTRATSHGGTRSLASMNVEGAPIRNGNRRSKKRPTPRHRETGALQGGRIRTRATSCGGTRSLASMNVEGTPIRNGNQRSKKRPTPRHRETGALQGGRIRTRATSCGGTRFADPTLLDHPSGCTACRLSSLRFGSRVHERRRDAHSKTEAKVRRNAQPVPPQNRSEAKITRAKPSLKHSRARDLFARAYVCPLLPTGRAIDSSSLIARPGNET